MSSDLSKVSSFSQVFLFGFFSGDLSPFRLRELRCGKSTFSIWWLQIWTGRCLGEK